MRKNPSKRTTMGGGQIRITQTYESEPCEEGTIDHRIQRIQMLQFLGNTPDLQNCGFAPFQKMDMRYDGGRWVITLEATSTE